MTAFFAFKLPWKEFKVLEFLNHQKKKAICLTHASWTYFYFSKVICITHANYKSKGDLIAVTKLTFSKVFSNSWKLGSYCGLLPHSSYYSFPSLLYRDCQFIFYSSRCKHYDLWESTKHRTISVSIDSPLNLTTWFGSINYVDS